jgi:uncharacterized protein YecE (DUF72 family)
LIDYPPRVTGTVRIGISGWRYAPWRGVFYPRDLPQRRELEFAAAHFPTVEINGSFYSLQSPASYARWRDETPERFVFSVKGSRYITHLLRLKDVETPLANFFASGVLALEEKLGPCLWQFPPMFRFDPDRLARFFELLPRDTAQALALARRRDARMRGRVHLSIGARRKLRHAIEIRHASFVDDAFLDLLRRHDVGLVVADTAGKWPKLFEVTSDFVYVRPPRRREDLHERVHAEGVGLLVAQDPGLERGGEGRLRLLRQRRQGPRAVRRALAPRAGRGDVVAARVGDGGAGVPDPPRRVPDPAHEEILRTSRRRRSGLEGPGLGELR